MSQCIGGGQGSLAGAQAKTVCVAAIVAGKMPFSRNGGEPGIRAYVNDIRTGGTEGADMTIA